MLLTADKVILEDGKAHAGVAIRIGANGAIQGVGPIGSMGRPSRNLKGKVLLPGFVNAHSHAFQRLLRGRTQATGNSADTFWTWRDTMYQAVQNLHTDEVFAASRQAFLEMALAGVTSVGEFHYVHHQPGGAPYPDTTVLADAVVRAARSVGVRLCLLRVVYLRGDFDASPAHHQRRFCDADFDAATAAIDAAQRRIAGYRDGRLTFGVAAHSVRAVPPDAIVALKVRYGHQPFHIHASEQIREVEGCKQHYGATPIALLHRSGVLDAATTLVHATHVEKEDVECIAKSGAVVCVCPSTEADLGDGLIPAETFLRMQVPLALGTDGQTLCSILEEARRIEMHERLRLMRRNVLSIGLDGSSARSVFEMATRQGARALGLPAGTIAAGHWADLVAFDLGDSTLVGCDNESLLAAIMFSADSRSVSDVMVHGRFIVQDGHHSQAKGIHQDFQALSDGVFGTLCP